MKFEDLPFFLMRWGVHDNSLQHDQEDKKILVCLRKRQELI
jgi:hypothetical protein